MVLHLCSRAEISVRSTILDFTVVQWLRLHTPNAGTQVQSLVRELDPTCHN